MAESWAKLARKLAAKQRQPMLWLLLSLLADEADRQGEDHPPLPWDTDAADDGK